MSCAPLSPDGASSERLMSYGENSSSSTSSMIWTTLPANESIAPAVTATGGEMPCRWKNRMFTAIRAIDDGRARFMNPTASCIA